MTFAGRFMIVVVLCDSSFFVAACGDEPATKTPVSSERTTKSGEGPLEPSAPANAPAPTSSVSDLPSGPAPATISSLTENRDRLLDTLAQRKSATRCSLWSSLTATQRGVFLTITDLLGRRSYMTNASGADSTGRLSKDDLAVALDHVTKVYEIRDSNGDNGGMNNNRIWLQVDETLIAALRSPHSALPEWSASGDLAGPHSPFDADSETVDGQPRGQAHFWSADSKSRPIGRPGVEDINDARIVEIDIDYDLFHNSNPEGTYFPNGKGTEHYTKVWSAKGAGGSPELDYVPTACP